jgi:hypothetical protein
VLLYRLISFALVVAVGWLIWGTTWLIEHARTGSATSSRDPGSTRALLPSNTASESAGSWRSLAVMSSES